MLNSCSWLVTSSLTAKTRDEERSGTGDDGGSTCVWTFDLDGVSGQAIQSLDYSWGLFDIEATVNVECMKGKAHQRQWKLRWWKEFEIHVVAELCHGKCCTDVQHSLKRLKRSCGSTQAR